MTYSEKLKHPKWQKKRLEILQRDGFKCRHCGDTETTLHVHHLKYTGNNPWDAPNDDLVSICEDCHSVDHVGLTELERYLLGIVRSLSEGFPFSFSDRSKFLKLINNDVRSHKS